MQRVLAVGAAVERERRRVTEMPLGINRHGGESSRIDGDLQCRDARTRIGSGPRDRKVLLRLPKSTRGGES